MDRLEVTGPIIISGLTSHLQCGKGPFTLISFQGRLQINLHRSRHPMPDIRAPLPVTSGH